jgi:hypothetical protein
MKLRITLLSAAITLAVSGCIETQDDPNVTAQMQADQRKQAAEEKQEHERQVENNTRFIDQCVKDGDTVTQCRLKLHQMIDDDQRAADEHMKAMMPPDPPMIMLMD